MSKRVITLIATAGVLVLAIAAYFIIKAIPPKPYVDTSERVQVDRFDVEKVDKMVLVSLERTISFVKKDGSWRVDLPYDIDIDQTKIEDIAYSFSSMYAESLVEESPSELAPYGLDNPQQTATATLTDGTTRTYYLGDRTPAGNTYYLQPKDSTSVYAVWMNHGSNFSTTIQDLRVRKMPTVDKENIRYIYLRRRNEKAVELQALSPASRNLYVFGGWSMTKPYLQPRGIDSEKLQALIDSIYFSDIKDFAADNVRDLSRYGLEPPRGEIILRDETTTLHLLVGDDLDEYTTYFRYPNSRNVYTIDRSRLELLQNDAFPLADKFAFIVNIDWVDRIVAQRRGGTSYTIDIKRESKDEQGNWVSTFTVNGKQVEDEKFRKFYQTIIGILLDGEAARDVRGTPVATVSFMVSADQAEGRAAQTVKLEYFDYSADFYLVKRDGVGEFVTAKNRDLEKLFREAEAIVQ